MKTDVMQQGEMLGSIENNIVEINENAVAFSSSGVIPKK